MKPFRLQSKHLIIVLVIAAGFYLVMDLNSRLNALNLKTQQHNVASTEVAYLEATVNALHTQIGFATSEVAVEEWARERGRMTRPGDVLVVPLPPENVTPQPVVTVAATPEPMENWEVWRILFFGP
ncbi:MAG TPA: hypothetical protein VFF68_13820 [Anaerolineaceae bacterium]|nr:hypothetical protein [Anaerolineaceae bacterium]